MITAAKAREVTNKATAKRLENARIIANEKLLQIYADIGKAAEQGESFVRVYDTTVGENWTASENLIIQALLELKYNVEFINKGLQISW